MFVCPQDQFGNVIRVANAPGEDLRQKLKYRLLTTQDCTLRNKLYHRLLPQPPPATVIGNLNIPDTYAMRSPHSLVEHDREANSLADSWSKCVPSGDEFLDAAAATLPRVKG